MPLTGDPRIDDTTATLICGSDEVGAGAYAGSLLVVAVTAPRAWTGPQGLTDSKKLNDSNRERFHDLLMADIQISMTFVWVTPETIDLFGIYKANVQAHLDAHAKLKTPNTLRVADGNMNLGPEIISLPKADGLVPAVSAASVLAKVTRDRYMTQQDALYPGYGFAKHKGYGVPLHEAALFRLGPCAIHRRSYGPVAIAARQKSEGGLPTLDDLFDGMK